MFNSLALSHVCSTRVQGFGYDPPFNRILCICSISLAVSIQKVGAFLVC